MKFYFVTRFMHKLKVSNKYKCNSESKLHESKFFRSVIPRNSRNANIIFSPKWSHKITHCTMQVLLLPTQQRDQDHRPSAQKPSNPSQQSQESQWCRHKMQESQAITLRSSQRCKWCRQTDGGDKEKSVVCCVSTWDWLRLRQQVWRRDVWCVTLYTVLPSSSQQQVIKHSTWTLHFQWSNLLSTQICLDGLDIFLFKMFVPVQCRVDKRVGGIIKPDFNLNFSFRPIPSLLANQVEYYFKNVP